jgi:hypothetical protein
MPIFDVQGPDGKAYQVDAPDIHAASSALLSAPVASIPFGATDELAHAFTMGLTRPVNAAVTAIGPGINQLLGRGNGETVGQAFQRGEREYDAARAAYKQGSPIASTALDVLGGAGSMGGLTGALPATALGRVAQGARIGGTYGGIEGLADASGNLSDRVQGGIMSALMGGAIGAAVPAAIDTARVVTAPVRAMISAARNPEQAAIRQVGQAMADDAISPAAARAALDEARQQGVRDMTLADVAGPNAQRLTAVYAKSPGPAKAAAMDFLESRAATRGENIVDVIRPDLGNPETAYLAIDRLIAQRAALARPAYEKAMADGADGVWNKDLQRLAGAPAIQEASHAAIPSLANRGIAEGFAAPRQNPLTFNSETGLASLSKLPNGNTRVPDLRFWDQVKRGLDAQIAKAKNFGDNAKVAELTGLKNELVTQLDKAVPSYARARQIFESPSASKDAIETGLKFLQMRPEEIRKTMSGLSQFDKDFARLGAARALQDLAGASTDRTRQLISGNMKARYAEIFPNKAAYDRAVGALEKIKAQNDLGRTVRGGSSTYENFAQAGDAKFDPSVLLHAAHGNVLGLTADALRGLSNRFGGITPKVASSGIKMMLNSSALNQQAALDAIERAYLAAQARPGNRGAFGRGIIGGTMGLLANPQQR